MMAEPIPAAGGSYVVWLYLGAPVVISVGRLGEFLFPGGHYYYAGSAFGPGGLAARLERHMRIATLKYWHIDFLRTRAETAGCFYAVGVHAECAWVERLACLSGASQPVKGFGASDCRSGCLSHLVHLGNPVDPPYLMKQLSLAANGAQIEVKDALKIG